LTSYVGAAALVVLLPSLVASQRLDASAKGCIANETRAWVPGATVSVFNEGIDF
jgi:hypothetical protein